MILQSSKNHKNWLKLNIFEEDTYNVDLVGENKESYKKVSEKECLGIYIIFFFLKMMMLMNATNAFKMPNDKTYFLPT